MSLIVALILSFILLIFSVNKGIFVAYPLILILIAFIAMAVKSGFKLKSVLIMAYDGGKKALIVLKIFILIGAVISVWMSAGTVPAIVYYGIKLLNPKIFVLSTFLICSFVSFLMGTSFGTAGTVGIAFIVMARSGGVNISLAAGAIIAGSYFGDRCSPMSSSASLVAALTKTDLYINIRNMIKTSVVSFILSCAIYGVLSVLNPLRFMGNEMEGELLRTFDINMIVLIPAAVILILAALKVDVKISILSSIAVACIISVTIQHKNLSDIIRYIFFGFTLDEKEPLKNIIKGGGIFSMLKVALVVFVSSAFAGVFEGTGMLNNLDKYIIGANNRARLFMASFILSIATAAFGCSQAIAIILTIQLVSKFYEKQNIDNYQLAADIENTAVIISPLIPWNIAGLVPATNLMVGWSFIPYSFYLYLIPIINFLYLKIKNNKVSRL